MTRPRRSQRSTDSPHDELEVKARVTKVAALRRALRRAGARLEFQGRMLDLRYDRGRELTVRFHVLRLRIYRGKDGRTDAVVTWKGPPSARGAYRHRLELEFHVSDPEKTRALFERLKYRVTRAIDRQIEVYRLGRATLRLERYPRMDTLLEVEGPPPAIERAIAATGLERSRFLSESLEYFLVAYRRRTGRPGVIARPDGRW